MSGHNFQNVLDHPHQPIPLYQLQKAHLDFVKLHHGLIDHKLFAEKLNRSQQQVFCFHMPYQQQE